MGSDRMLLLKALCPMLECSLCGMGLHLSCAKIKTNVPDFFYCQKGKELYPESWQFGDSQIWRALTALSVGWNFQITT